MTSLPKIADFANETFMLDLMFKFYNQRHTIHCLFDPKSCNVFEFLVMLKKLLDQEKSLTEKKKLFLWTYLFKTPKLLNFYTTCTFAFVSFY